MHRVDILLAGWLLAASPGAAAALPLQSQAVPRSDPGSQPVDTARSPAALRELEAFFDAEAAAGRFSGAIAIGREGRPLFQKAWGSADRRQRIANNPETKFNLGSMNKMFTGVAIAQLVAQGKLRYDDPLSKYYPDFPNPRDAQKIRVEHLLTHTSGLGSYFSPRYMRERPQSIAGVIDITREDAALAFEPGTRWRYSNIGFLLLGGIIEKVTGQDYFEYIRANVYGPAGMPSSSWPSSGEVVPNLAVAYAPPRSGRPDTTAQPLYRGTSAGGGVSTLGDLLRFADALLKGKLVAPEQVRRITTAKPEVGSPRYGYGFGVDRGNGEPLIVGHNGGSPGVFANLDIYLEQGYATVLLMNNAGGQPRDDYVDVLRRAVLALTGLRAGSASRVDTPPPPPAVALPQTPPGRAVAALIETARRAADTTAVRRFVLEQMIPEFREQPMADHYRIFERLGARIGNATVTEVRAVDDTSLAVTFRGPRGGFLIELSTEARPPHRVAALRNSRVDGQPRQGEQQPTRPETPTPRDAVPADGPQGGTTAARREEAERGWAPA